MADSGGDDGVRSTIWAGVVILVHGRLSDPWLRPGEQPRCSDVTGYQAMN